MRLIFILAGLLSEVLLLIFINILRKKQTPLCNVMMRMFVAAFISVLANVIIAISKIELLNSFSFALYFSSINFITYYLWMFTLVYTDRVRHLDLLSKVWRIIVIIDSLDLFISVFTGHMFSIYTMTVPDGSLAYQTKPTMLFNVHLALCYLPILITMILLFESLVKSYGFYRLKYFPILASLLVIVILNIIYMYFSMPFDLSVLFYALTGLLLFFFSIYFIPNRLMSNILRLSVDSMKEGLLLFDAQQNSIYINSTARKFFDFPADSLSFDDYPISTWLADKGNDRLTDFVETFPMHIGDDDLMLRVDYKKCTDSKGRLLGSFFVFEDVTRDQMLMQSLEAARAEANQASIAKSLFLANMSHEIRTPINSILGMNEMILRETSEEHVTEYATDIQKSGDTLLALINNILDISKIESGKMKIEPAAYNVYEMIRECYLLVSPRAVQKDLPIYIDCVGDIPSTLMGDNQRIKQVLVNLLTNSIKYTQYGQIKLTVSFEKLSEKSGTLRMVVSDSGQGISEEDISKLFRLFQRVDEDRNRNIEGTGLGLALSRELVVMMGGDITVKSTPKKGSDFTVTLFQAIVDPTPSGEFILQKESTPVRKKYKESFHAPEAKILAVDDVELNLKLISSLLKKTMVKITPALTGEKAIELCANEDFDMILMDHMMPPPDGYETMKRIKEAGGHNASIPIIVLTANAIEGVEETYLSMGFDGYLSKPVHSKDLEEMITRFLPKEKLMN